MSRKQLWIIYGILCFLLIWGWGLIDTIKFQRPIEWRKIFSPFHFSQLIYMLSTFWLCRYIFKKYYTTKKYWQLLLSILLLIGCFILMRYAIEEKIYYALFGFRNYRGDVRLLYYGLDNIYYAIVYIVWGTLVFLIDNQLTAQKNEASLNQERINAELAFLRSQVSPHFLFNSLNNIYSLSYKKSDKAPDAILKLSELTRYMLYEKQDLVPLEKEWEYIQNFISLQQLRHDAPLAIELTIKGDMETRSIAPYLLIPFVENAFKHGVVLDKESPLRIELLCTANEVIFKVVNKIAQQQKDKDGGIGLENVRRRLELLYPDTHELVIEKQQETFDICLRIKLAYANKNSGSR